MPKAADDVKELQRNLARLQRLNGRVVLTADGPYLIWPRYVKVPEPLLDECRSLGVPRLQTLRDCVVLDGEPIALTERWLGGAQRDLSRLQAGGKWMQHANEEPRMLRKFPEP